MKHSSRFIICSDSRDGMPGIFFSCFFFFHGHGCHHFSLYTANGVSYDLGQFNSTIQLLEKMFMVQPVWQMVSSHL